MAQNKPKGLAVHEKEAADAIAKTALEQAKNKEGVSPSPSEKDALDKLVKEAQSADIEKSHLQRFKKKNGIHR